MTLRILACALLLITGSAHAVPSVIAMIRHAEKPKDDTDSGLSKKGRRRSEKLVNLFTEDPQFPTPSIVYAMGQASRRSSRRPILTVLPLVDHLRMIHAPIDFRPSILRDDYSDVIDELMAGFENQVALICWEHDALVDMAQELGDRFASSEVQQQIPTRWDGSDYQSVWKFKIDAGRIQSFEILSQPF